MKTVLKVTLICAAIAVGFQFGAAAGIGAVCIGGFLLSPFAQHAFAAVDIKPSTVFGAGFAAASHAISFNTNQASASATNTVSDTGGVPDDNDTVTVNGRVYTFKTTLTGAADEIHINGQDGSLTNLAAAINYTGTIGTDYGTGTVINANVSASGVGSHSITLTAKTPGVAGNSLTLARSGANLAVGGSTFSGGVDIALPQLSDAEANPTTGDARAILFALCEKAYQWYKNLATADQPSKLAITRGVTTARDGTVQHTYTLKFTVTPPTGEYSIPAES